MITFTKYLIKDSDEFHSANYPNLVSELACIHKALTNVPNAFRANIIISYTKDHSLNLEWIKANPEFAQLVTSGALPISNIEALFEASTKNLVFRQQFEEYLKSSF
ncbi:MAG: hypothetical protein ICV51_12855 [Flavisolibacter sp.]|nr:hypothetical protein [Flavisolibacter sp.]